MTYRQAGDNTRAIDIIDVVHNLGDEALLLSLDVEMVFDHLSWPFLFTTLEHVGIQGPL